MEETLTVKGETLFLFKVSMIVIILKKYSI